jgi:hypothetical protein
MVFRASARHLVSMSRGGYGATTARDGGERARDWCVVYAIVLQAERNAVARGVDVMDDDLDGLADGVRRMRIEWFRAGG